MIKFRVNGEPLIWPTKDISVVNGKPRVRKRDPKGRKAAWIEQVRMAAVRATRVVNYRIERKDVFFSKPQAIKILIVVYRTPPKRNKLPYPSSRPDLDNFCYLPHNVLEGVCYEDDSQICHLNEWKLWATDIHPPGLEITIGPMRNLTEIEWVDCDLNEYGRL